MAKIGPASFKYVLKAKFRAESMVEKPDIIGAIFGQTEGLLGDELDLREAQRNGKIGRIEVESTAANGETTGEIIIPTSLDVAETALIGAAIETIDRIGPSKATIKVESVEDVRVSKREYIAKRAEDLLQTSMSKNSVDTTELLQKLYENVRQKELIEYGPEKLPAGPDIDNSEDVIIVEGRADVLNMLKHGFTNVIGMNGTTIPQSVIDLSHKKIITLFVDGDRGGDMIVNAFTQSGHVDFIAKAPSGREVEELAKKEINQALRARVTLEEYSPGTFKKEGNGQKKEERTVNVPDDIKKKMVPLINEIIGTRGAFLTDNNFNIVGRIPYKEVDSAILNIEGVYAVILDGIVDDDIVRSAEEVGVAYAVGSRVSSSSDKIVLLSYEDVGYKYR
jgi:DNA primase